MTSYHKRVRKKVGTSLDEALLDRARAQASREGRALASLIEDALNRYLALKDSAVERNYGLFPLSREDLQQILDLDPYDS